MLRLLGRRLSSTEIGVELVGESTVTTHVSRIIIEFQLRDCAQAVVFAYETGLSQSGDAASDLDSRAGTVCGTWLVQLDSGGAGQAPLRSPGLG